MFYGILNQKLQLPSGAMLSEDIQDLLERMLLKVPESRPTLEEVLKHHWCGGHTLQQINLKLLQPPFKPNLLKYNFDDSEFGGQ
jgi:serum/glucocorticoid-regulated kinase 2